MIKFGYNRDKKKGHKQGVIGLIINHQGCPVGCEVFEGNKKNVTTVTDKIDQIRRAYGLKHFIFVGDRGMVTQGQFEKMRTLQDICAISALTHAHLKELLGRSVIQIGLFDEKKSVEIIDPDDEQLRYTLCKNPITEKQEGASRNRLLKKMGEGLEEITNYKRATTVEELGARVGKVLAKYKMGKFIKWSIQGGEGALSSQGHKLIWKVDQDKVIEAERLDGCYIIRSTAPGQTVDGLSAVVEAL